MMGIRTGATVHTTNAAARDDRDRTEMRHIHHRSRNGYRDWNMHRDLHRNSRGVDRNVGSTGLVMPRLISEPRFFLEVVQISPCFGSAI
jgi:hypothetical protein